MDTDDHNQAVVGNHEGHEALYGRRVETDRSWTVYHVFTGAPADGRGVMTGLSRPDATDRMMSLNRRLDASRHALCAATMHDIGG